MKTAGRDFLVYLAGPITGLTYADVQSWREYVTSQLPTEIRAISPLRAKAQALDRVGIINDSYSYESNPLTSQRGLTTRDRMDCRRADAAIMNLLGAKTVTIGTMIEIGWLDTLRIPIILVMEDSGNLHDHPMVRDCVGFRVNNLDAAVAVCEAVLMPEGIGTPREPSDDKVIATLVDAFAAKTGSSKDDIEPIRNWNVPVLAPEDYRA